MDIDTQLPPTARDLIERQPSAHSLLREFYSDEAIYRLDLDRIWRKGWLFVGHSCEIPTAGDYFTFEVDKDSLIVLRGDDGKVHALHNVCRHRGSLICEDACGHLKKLVCPYHRWAYDLDGS